MTQTADPLDEGRMSLLEHLNELRTRLIKCVAAIGVMAIVAWIFYNPLFDFLLEPHCEINGTFSLDGEGNIIEECETLAVSPLEPFSVRMTLTGYAGLGAAMPVVLWQLWRFIAPGLYPNERRYGIVFVAVGFSLFCLGVSLAYWSLPRALEFLTEIGGDNITNFYRPREYVGFATKMMIAFGIGFQFPIVLVFLQMIGLVKNEQLRSGRQYAIVGIVVLVAVITPSGDPFTLMVLSVPMYIFYEVAILYGRLRERRKKKAVTAG